MPRLLLLAFLASTAFAQTNYTQYVINTVAGRDWVFPTITGPAVSAPLGNVTALAFDPSGLLYIADPQNNAIFKIDASGNISTFAGNGLQGFSGEGGPATSASLSLPTGLGFDAAGNLYFTDQGNARIRQVALDGTIHTIAGAGTPGFFGDGGPAINALVQNPAALLVDPTGNIFFVDNGNNRVRKIDTNGNISTVAGDGTSATLNNPKDIALDSQGNLYVSDYGNSLVKKFSAGSITIVAGRVGLVGNDGDQHPATSARINSPWGLAFDSAGDLLFADSGNSTIRQVNPAGIISTIAGNSIAQFGGDGGPALSASFFVPAGLLIGPGGRLFIADRGNQRVRQFAAAGAVSTLAGNQQYRVVPSSAAPTQTYLYGPQGIAIGSIAHDLLIAESRGNAVRDISVTQTVLTKAGLSLVGGITRDGLTGANTLLNAPYGVVTGPDGTVYYADTANNVVRSISPVDQTVHTVAGQAGTAGYNGDSILATTALLNQPRAVLVDSAGDIFIADTGNNRIRLIDPSGTINTYAGTGIAQLSGDGGPANQAGISAPYGMAFFGNSLYFADQGNHRIRSISTTHVISTYAGSGSAAAPNGENGPAIAANVPSPFGLAFDSAGQLYYSENLFHVVRKIDTHGIVTTIVGNQRPGFSGDGGLAPAAQLNSPAGVVVDPNSGYLYIADSGNDRVRAVIPIQPTFTVSSNNLALTASGGLTNNPAQVVNVTSTLSGLPLTGLAYTVAPSSSSPWLVVTPVSGTLPQQLLVSANATNLPPGSNTGTFTITAPGANPPTITVNASVTVGPTLPPQLAANTTQVALSVSQGSSAVSSNISIANNGSGTINYTATVQTVSGGSWLSLTSATSGSLGNQAPISLVATANPASLAPGVYRGSVTVSGTSLLGTITPIAIPVSLTVSQSTQVIQLTQTALNFRAITTGTSPLPQSFGITNTGSGTMSWTATAVDATGAPVPWIGLSASSGAVSTPITGASTVAVTVTPLNMNPGDYYAKIQISSSAANSPQTVSVVMTVLAANTPSFADIQPSALVFTAPAGAVPSSQIIRIATVGIPTGKPISYTATAITADGNAWFADIPRTNSISVGNPDRIVVQPDFTLLAPGTYTGNISLLLSDGSTRTIKIMSVVTAGATSSFQPAAACSNNTLNVQFAPPLLTGSNSFRAYAGQQNTLSATVLYQCSGATFTSQNGQVTAYFKDGEPAQSLTFNPASVAWTTIWSPPGTSSAPVAVQLTATGFNGANPAAGQSDTFVASFVAGAAVPLVAAGGVVSAASFQADVPIGVGGLITVFGNQLVTGTGQAATVPLPQSLSGTQVLLENIPVPILYASGNQINVQVPYETNVNVPQHLVVQRGSAVSGPFSIQVASVQPAIFLANAAGQGIIVNSTTNAIASSANPVTAGDYVTIYCTGLGPTSPSVPTGSAATGASYITTGGIMATIGGQNALLVYAGLTPGFPGLYQINAQIPAGVTGSAVPVIVTLAGQVSPPATIAIR